MFSKTGVDEGTDILLNALLNEELSGKGLDLGCGAGVIGIAVAKTRSADMQGVDVNPRAVELAQINAANNRVQVHFYESDGFSEVNDVFDFIITNPPIRAGKKVIYKMFEDAQDHLRPGGKLYAVIRRKQGAESAVKKFMDIYGNCEVICRERGYWVLKSQN